jgi:chemotaxis protein CheX
MSQASATQATAAPSAAAGASVINPQLVVPFMNAVREVFKKMAGLDIKVERPFLKTSASPAYDVCGIIGFSGQITGSVVLSFSDAAASKLVEAFAGTAFPRDTPDFADAIGELANMVAGSAKQHLGAAASISVPSVVIGSGYTVASLSGLPCLVIPCNSPHGAFAVEVCIKRNGA